MHHYAFTRLKNMVNRVASRLIKHMHPAMQKLLGFSWTIGKEPCNSLFSHDSPSIFLSTLKNQSHSKVDRRAFGQQLLQDKYAQYIFFSLLLLLKQQARQARGSFSSPKSFAMALAILFLPLSPGWDSGIITRDSSRELTQDLYSAQ